MKMPFPGMDPYLEHRGLWPDVHNRLITTLADALTPLVAPNYYIGVESRAYIMKTEGGYLLGGPDVSVISPTNLPSSQGRTIPSDDVAVLDVEVLVDEEVSHYYLEVRSTHTDELVTAIELLSPVNKVDSNGRLEYEQKRRQVMASLTNYIEIDLLRVGEPLPTSSPVISDYRILVRRGWLRYNKAQLYAFNLPTPIPPFPLPLMPDEEEPLVPLNDIVHDLYTRARFDLRIDYNKLPTPPLSETNISWIKQLLAI